MSVDASAPRDRTPAPRDRTVVALGVTTVVTHGGSLGVLHDELGQDTIADVGPATASDELAAGETVGRYVIVQRLGAGGMGTVYEARDPDLDRPVAIKVLRGAVNEEARLRMEREARALARLSHPNVVQVYEIGRVDGRTFIAMELVRGRPLDAWQRERPGWRECVRVYLQAGRGLAAAHAEGLVHRDFKPHNCILGDDERVRVLDFGLARSQEPATVDSEFEGRVVAVDALTRTGSFMGTPAYTALVQFRGAPADAHSDQFAFCVALHEAIHGERPFAGRTTEELTRALAREEIRTSPQQRRLPRALRRALRRGLARDPAARWPSMDALLAELQRVVGPRRRRVAAVVVGVGLLAVGGGLWQQARLRCGGAATELHGVWDPGRREALRAALEGTAVPYAATTATHAVEGLDAYAQGWAGMHEEACEATRVRSEQTEEVMSLRMACLAGRKLALREAVDVLIQVDADAIARAGTVVSTLPSLARCEDVEALRAGVPPPDDSSVAIEVEALRERLARARALETVGRYDEALRMLGPLRREAQGLGYAPLRAELEYRQGAVLQAQGQHEPAEQALVRAFELALAHGHDEVATDSASLLVFVVGAQRGQLPLGRQWGTIAIALAQRQREASALAVARLHLSMVLREQGEQTAALEHTEEALTILRRLRGPRHTSVAFALGVQAVTLESLGEPERALAALHEALAIEEEALGGEHPSVATTVGNIGRLLAQAGALDDAVVNLERAGAIYARVGDRASEVAVLASLGRVRFEQGRLDDAADLLERALGQGERALGPMHPDVATLVGNLANLRGEQGRVSEAVPLQRRALAIREAALGPDHEAVAVAADNLGLLLGQGEASAEGLEEAVALHRRALAIRERIHGPEHPDVAGSAFELGVALEALGQRAAAREQLERARAIYVKFPEQQEFAAQARAWLDEHPP
ncbi:serine/threonine-protein kinase [Paraliomyxa miuraensis]|uniref:serine/threonine-protein kinase n=1 Tax=Paraliomyxa miuraensis TaxID=376150 RepID=UPI002256402F|nr:serine/threonine-protein kinase [Paraliomyxa miuraensis]MCX4243450.1 serine/threonine-protein kinase [Paraliomyxa miuraensis]